MFCKKSRNVSCVYANVVVAVVVVTHHLRLIKFFPFVFGRSASLFVLHFLLWLNWHNTFIMHSCSLFIPLKQTTHTDTLTYTLTHTHTHTLFLSLSISHTHTNTYTHTHKFCIYTHTHTYIHTLQTFPCQRNSPDGWTTSKLVQKCGWVGSSEVGTKLMVNRGKNNKRKCFVIKCSLSSYYY